MVSSHAPFLGGAILVRERLSSRSLSPTVSVCCSSCVCVCLLVHVGFLAGVLVLTLVFLTLVLLVSLELPVLLLPLLVFECWLLFAYRMTYTCAHCVVRQRNLRSPHTFFPLGLGPGVGGLLHVPFQWHRVLTRPPTPCGAGI